MQCPRCGLTNPPEGIHCDCGYDFKTGGVHRVSSPAGGLPLASLGERLGGQMLDGVVAYGGLFLGTYITGTLGVTSAPAMILCLLYLLFADGIGGGQSIGKKLLGTSVVFAATGGPCGHTASFVRNAMMMFGIFDWMFIFGDRHQRLGDKLAGTVVVKVRRAA
jgi:uncharacterized RDD family membrane protein YckC